MILRSIEWLIAFAVFLQALELLILKRKIGRWDPWQTNVHDYFYIGLCLLVAFSAVIVMIHTNLLALSILWLGIWAIAARWRGTFNGASDSMTFHVLGALLLARVYPTAQTLSLIYIGLQVTLSYFVAGLSKLFLPSWRSGFALKEFLLRSNAAQPRTLFQRLTGSPQVLLALSWGVILFECLFPLLWIWAPLRPMFIGLGLLFHLANFYAFGLNRFVFAWLAAYPALYAWGV